MNWGKGITIVIILFMAFIVSFVVRAYKNETDLVQEDYYQHEVDYDRDIESKNNYFKLGEKVVIEKSEKGIEIAFPNYFKSKVEGNINFYRPQSKAYDRNFKLELNQNNLQILDYSDFVEGFYEVTISWSNEGTSYIFEDEIIF